MHNAKGTGAGTYTRNKKRNLMQEQGQEITKGIGEWKIKNGISSIINNVYISSVS